MRRRKKINPPKRLRLRLLPKRIAELLGRVEVQAGTAWRGTPCWYWAGHRDEHGYGQVRAAGKVQWAHRVFYAVFKRAIEDGNEIDHGCRNHPCCNPHHLIQRTVAGNRAAGNRARARATVPAAEEEEVPF